MSLESAISALVSRLEAVTARLESVEKQLATGGPAPAPAPARAAGGGGGAVEVAPYVNAFDNLTNTFITKHVELSKVIGGKVAEQAEFVKKTVDAQRDFLAIASQSKKPSVEVLSNLVKPVAEPLDKAIEIREKNRANADFNLLSVVSEGLPALRWIVVSPTPGPFVEEAKQAGEFYSNRILREFKGKDQTRVDWTQNFIKYLVELRAYIKEYHTTEVAWNPRGGDASAAKVSPAAGAPAAGGPPPPPKLPAPGALDVPAKGSAAPPTAALFAEINSGGVDSVVGRLKHVTKDMKTKNQPKSEPVAAPAPSAASSAPRSSAAKAPARPLLLALEGNKWRVEHHVNNQDIVIENPEPKHVVYIYQCNNSVVKINGKVNAITLDECKRTAVVFENAIATCEVVNCNSVQVQCTGAVPAFAVDKTSGVHFFLAKTCLHAEIVTSKSGEMNVNIPNPADPDDVLELAIPEQYKTIIRDGKLITETTSHV